MANSFSKEERVAFEEMLAGFDDALVVSKLARKYKVPGQMAERASDTIWRPVPYIMQSFDGMDQTPNFTDTTQLSVPATLGYKKSVPWQMSATDLRDALQEGRLYEAAKQKLASDINVALLTTLTSQATVCVTSTTAASSFSQVANCEAAFNELGVPMNDRKMILSSRDYNGLAADLAGRGTLSGKPASAYERAFVGQVAGFDTFKLDYALSLAASPENAVTVNGANQRHTPASTSTAGTGETSNVDNRTFVLTVAVGVANCAVGDAITIAGVNSVHPITKEDTGQLKTFRVRGITATTLTISPPIIAVDGAAPSDAEYQYQNVTATPAHGAAIAPMNFDAASINCFWQGDALELLTGSYAIPSDAGAQVMRGSTESGLELVLQKQYAIETMQTKYRLDCLFGTVLLNPEMAGILLFSQTP